MNDWWWVEGEARRCSGDGHNRKEGAFHRQVVGVCVCWCVQKGFWADFYPHSSYEAHGSLYAIHCAHRVRGF